MSCLGHLQEGISHVCRVCGTELTDENWFPSLKKNGDYICKRCKITRVGTWTKGHRKGVNIYQKGWNKANLKEHTKYLGVVTCPKCGKKGYKQFYYSIHENLGTISRGHTQVQHHHTEHDKTIYDGICYIGMGQV